MDLKENYNYSKKSVVKHGVKHIIKKIFKVIGISFISIIVLCLLVGLIIYIKYKPVIDKAHDEAFTKEGQLNNITFKRAGSSIVLDKDGKKICKLTGNTFKYDEIGDISPYVQQGYIAVEDKDFLHEEGVSYKGMARAAWLYIKNRGKVTQGGSTITQQLVKNVLLNQDRTFSRKIAEIFLAPQIEKRYSKIQILEYYTNNCYYGSGYYGIESASEHFFSKQAKNLTLAEASTLVGLSNNPTMYSPTLNPVNCKTRRNFVLSIMLQQKKITSSEYNQAKNTPLVLNIKPAEKVEENYASSYAVDCAVKAMMQENGFSFKYLFNSDKEKTKYEQEYKDTYLQYDRMIRSGGYTLYTTIEQSKQAILQNAVDSELEGFTETDAQTKKYCMQGAAVTIDNSTGYVVAIVGGRGSADTFNRAFLAYRQPGSSIKPVLDYTPAFENGYHPLSKITDQYIQNGPKNDENTFYGPVTLRWATEMSLNTVPYQLLAAIKPKTGLAYLSNMKYAGLCPEDNNPIISIGGFTDGVTPCEQAGGYYTLENKGYYVETSCLKKMTYINNDNVIYINGRQGKQVYSAESAYMMTDILKGVISTDYGTGHALKVGNQIVAGKTGTTSDCKDGWFCGYSAYYTTITWCGYDTPRSVDNLYGATYPGHIWLDIMTALHNGLTVKDFDKPSGISIKNIDSNGNYTDENTGIQDLCSTVYLEKEEKEQEEAKRKAAAKKQEEWDGAEPAREKAAENYVSVYETLHYNTEEDLQSVDKYYNKTLAANQIVDNKKVKSDLTIRLQAHHDAIQPERDAIQKAIDKENQAEADAQAQKEKQQEDAINKAKAEADAEDMQAQLESQAETDAQAAVSKIENEANKADKSTLESDISTAISVIYKVADESKRNAFMARVNSIAVIASKK